MKITKFGHCCLLIEQSGLRILTDPGSYSVLQNEVKDIDLVLITHEHGDHLHIDSLKTVLQNNPQAKIVTNNGVGVLLKKEGISYELLDDGKTTVYKDVLFEAFGREHAEIYRAWKKVENTSYFIGKKFFYPGDAFLNPNREIEILALPVAGPWLKLSESIDYALLTKPKKCFPVHDGNLKAYSSHHNIPATILPESGIEFIIPEIGTECEF